MYEKKLATFLYALHQSPFCQVSESRKIYFLRPSYSKDIIASCTLFTRPENSILLFLLLHLYLYHVLFWVIKRGVFPPLLNFRKAH